MFTYEMHDPHSEIEFGHEIDISIFSVINS